ALPRFAAVLDAEVQALNSVSLLDLGAAITECAATLDWMLCKTAASLATTERVDPVVGPRLGRPGGVATRRFGGPDTPVCSEFLPTEIALAFNRSEQAATAYLAVGLDLRHRLPHTNNDFGGGRLTYAHAKIISETTRHSSADIAARLDPILAAAATTRTPNRLRSYARRQVAKHDAAAMRRRHQQAYNDRTAMTFPLGDGIGAFSINHDETVLATVADQIASWGRQRHLHDPTTPLCAHEADAAVHLLLGQHPLTGLPLLPTGPATPRRPPTDPVPSQSLPGRPLPDPRCYLPARTELRMHMHADTLLGLDDEACELEGHGPITADQARRLALATADSTVLRRVFTDPADDTIMFLDANTYRFTRDQAEAIRTLHPLSTFPGATTPAAACDLDHKDPYRHPRRTTPAETKQTIVANGQPLGRRHHRARTHAGWQPKIDPDDPHTICWTSPLGRTYTVTDHHGA
nr:DUF222 domain-containing protein [Nocardioidaceae bacterium]